MTESLLRYPSQDFDLRIYWKEVDGLPALTPLVPAAEFRITPTGRYEYDDVNRLISGQFWSNYWNSVDPEHIKFAAPTLRGQRILMSNTTLQSTGMALSDMELDHLRQLRIGPGFRMPGNLETYLGITPPGYYPNDYEQPATMRISNSGSPADSVELAPTGFSLASNGIILDFDDPFEDLYEDNIDDVLSDRSVDEPYIVEWLPVYYQSGGGDTAVVEGLFTQRVAYMVRDDIDSEGLVWDASQNLFVEVRTTSFICRRELTESIGMGTLLSEYNVWDGSKEIWEVQSVTHLDRARLRQVQCRTYVEQPVTE